MTSEVIYESLVSDFPGAMQSISVISRNHQGGKDFIRCEVKAFNFDTILNVCGAEAKKEKSPDALFCCDGSLYFIEFKEGSHDRSDVRSKIHEGIITLFQYASSKGIVGRDEFLGISIKYAVVKRGPCNAESSFLRALEDSQDIFGLKNMEGLLLRRTAVRWFPESIFKLLNKVSNGSVDQIEYVAADQLSAQIFP